MSVATLFSPIMSALTGNSGGAIESLPNVTLHGARERTSCAVITLASQASGSVFGLFRLPVGAIITGITINTSISLGSATIALGDSNTSNLYMSAATFTSTNTPTRVGNATQHASPITSGYDCVTGLASTSYEDVTMTTATAALPSSGTLVIIIEWALD